MHERQWFRAGLLRDGCVLAGLGLAGAVAAGCGDDNGPGASSNDASIDSSISEPDTGGGFDAGPGAMDAEASAPPGHARVYVVNASETAPAFRFCFGLATQADGGAITVLSMFAAAPDAVQSSQQPYPGLFPGTGGALDDHGFDLAVLNVAAFAIDATKISGDTADAGGERNCAQLVGADGQGSGGSGGGALKLGTDYWEVGVIPAGTLLAGTSWVFAITGCPGGAPRGAVPFCGPGYDPANGNLGFATFKLDSTTKVDDASMGAQFAQASYPWDLVKSQAATQLDAGGLMTVAAFLEPASAPPDAGPGDDAGDAASEAGEDSSAPADSGPGGDAASEAEADSGPPGDAAASSPDAADAADASADDATVEAGDDSGGDASDNAGDAAHEAGKAFGPTTSPVQVPLALTDTPFGMVNPPIVKPVSGLTFDGTSAFATAVIDGLDPAPVDGIAMASGLPQIQRLTYGSQTPPAGGALANGASFVFVLVGNPTLPPLIAADGGAAVTPDGGAPAACLTDPANPCHFNMRSAHFLAFPTHNQ